MPVSNFLVSFFSVRNFIEFWISKQNQFGVPFSRIRSFDSELHDRPAVKKNFFISDMNLPNVDSRALKLRT